MTKGRFEVMAVLSGVLVFCGMLIGARFGWKGTSFLLTVAPAFVYGEAALRRLANRLTGSDLQFFVVWAGLATIVAYGAAVVATPHALLALRGERVVATVVSKHLSEGRRPSPTYRLVNERGREIPGALRWGDHEVGDKIEMIHDPAEIVAMEHASSVRWLPLEGAVFLLSAGGSVLLNLRIRRQVLSQSSEADEDGEDFEGNGDNDGKPPKVPAVGVKPRRRFRRKRV